MKQLISRLILVLVGAGLWSTVALAVPVSGLYSATAVVSDQDPATRKAAMPELLEQVVGRLVGEPDAGLMRQRWPQLQNALRKPENYLEQYLYQRLTGQPGQLRLRVEFDQRALDALVQRLNLPQWGADRPEVLTVLAWEGDGRRAVLASAPSSLLAADLLAEVELVAQKAGLPIALPLMDLQDQRDLPFSEIRAGFHDRVLDVATRYGADAVLVGRLKMAAGNGALAARDADVKWTLLQRKQTDQHTSRYGSVTEGLEAGLWMATRSLAQRYAVQGVDPNAAAETGQLAAPEWTLNVLGIKDFPALKAVEKHLQSRAVVSAVQLSNMSETNGQILATFKVDLKTDADKFEQALRVGRMLSPTTSPMASDNSEVGMPTQREFWYRLSR